MSNAYDDTQYESYAYNQTHPEHLYTLAKLFSLKPTNFRKAKVLELGAASGGNIIPMAYNFPDSHFLGIDLSKNQVEDGNAMIESLNLKNIELRHQSILDFEASEGKFDYIICHGIYSWVQADVQDKILSIFEKNLAPQGVAYISYNTLPGWSMVKSIREMMLYHTENIKDPKEKASQARALLQFISEGLEGEQTSYADFLANEIGLLKNQPDSYLLHDHLEANNTPVYFYELIEQAANHNLSYLSDAQLVSMFVGNLPSQFAQEISKVKSIVVANQYMDFIRNMRFRCTLFCHKDVTINRNLDTANIENFHLSFHGKTNVPLDDESVKEGVEVKFISPSVTLTTKNEMSKTVLRTLIEAQKPLGFDSLISKVLKSFTTQTKEAVRTHIHQDLNLLRLVLGGIIQIHSNDGNYIHQAKGKPRTTRLAIEQAKRKNYVVNQRHEMVALNPLERLMIQKLDGEHSNDALTDFLVKEVQKGTFNVLDDNKQPITNVETLAEKMSTFVNTTLTRFGQCALLVQ